MNKEPADPPADLNPANPRLYSQGDQHALWRWLRANDPVRWQPPTDLPGFWVLTRYDDQRAVCRDPAAFSSAKGILLRPEELGSDAGGGRMMALTDPPRHRQLRDIVDDWFALRSVRAMEAEIRQVTAELVARALEHESCDFVSDVAARVPLYAICKIMGVPREDWEHLFALTNDAFGTDEAIVQRLAHLDILRYFEDLAAARGKNPADDLVTVLVTAEIDGEKLSQEELVLDCDNLLVGGTENTRITAAGGMLAFLEHPVQWDAMTRDPSLLPSAVEEVLRWTSAATHVMRVATRRMEIGGHRIAEGERVTLWIPSANRDEAVFDEPDRFDVSRKPNRHLALGIGEHFCLGNTLARTELRLLYGELLRQTARIEPAGEPVLLNSIITNGPEHLPVRLTRS
jgi:cytochrome P450